MIAEGAEWHAFGFVTQREPDVNDLTEALMDFMGVYCDTAALMAADWYNSRDAESKFFARPVSVVPPERAADTARWVFKLRDPKPLPLAKRVASATYSMVFDAARDTLGKNASEEGVAVARVEEPGACDDCVRLSTRRPKFRHSSSDDVSWERHQRCEFLFEPVRSGIWVPPEATEHWSHLIDEARLAGNSNEQEIAKFLERH